LPSDALALLDEPVSPTSRALALAEHSAAPAGGGVVGRPPADWRELIASGRYSDGLRAAERAGFTHACRTANEEELLSLADAARLFGRTARAVEALGILRQRFPRSARAATAAFALGRIAFERQGAYAEAARWFAAYLDEMPNGPLMGDAVGRLMEAHQRAGDRSHARADAESYLGRFPAGPYAAAARAILAE
jgi:TolA-binding protein